MNSSCSGRCDARPRTVYRTSHSPEEGRATGLAAGAPACCCAGGGASWRWVKLGGGENSRPMPGSLGNCTGGPAGGT